MKRIVLYLIVPFIIFTYACSGSDDSELQLGDPCGINKCINGNYYHCLLVDEADQAYFKIDLIISCEESCQLLSPKGSYVFTGTCGEHFLNNNYQGCCNCYSQEENIEYCKGGWIYY